MRKADLKVGEEYAVLTWGTHKQDTRNGYLLPGPYYVYRVRLDAIDVAVPRAPKQTSLETIYRPAKRHTVTVIEPPTPTKNRDALDTSGRLFDARELTREESQSGSFRGGAKPLARRFEAGEQARYVETRDIFAPWSEYERMVREEAEAKERRVRELEERGRRQAEKFQRGAEVLKSLGFEQMDPGGRTFFFRMGENTYAAELNAYGKIEIDPLALELAIHNTHLVSSD